MSVRQAQREIDSAEFGEWMAVYQIEGVATGKHEPTPDELAAKIGAWASRSSSPTRAK